MNKLRGCVKEYQVSGDGYQVDWRTCIVWFKVLVLGALVLFTACGEEAAVATTAPIEMQVILVNSEITTEPTRFAVALLGPDQQFIHDAAVRFEYYDLSDANHPILEATNSALTRQTADGFSTIYTDRRRFDRVGSWGVQVIATLSDGAMAQQGISFEVVPQTASLAVGEVVPRVETPTDEDAAGDLSQISTATDPVPGLYKLSLEEALSNGRLTILYFSTPAFCSTRLCAPGYDELTRFYERNGDAYNIIHVEVFTGLPNPAEQGWPLAPAMTAFGLTTEPWLYMIDASGEVLYRVEGLFTAKELEAILETESG